MHRNLTLLAALLAAIVLATPIPATAQDFIFSLDSLNFGDVPIGLEGIPEGNLLLTIQNNTGGGIEASLGFANFESPESFEFISQETAGIRLVILDIYSALGEYVQDFGESPSGCYELAEAGYLDVDGRWLWEWNFEFVGANPVVQIKAISENREILFDIYTGGFVPNEGDDEFGEVAFRPYEERELILCYHPENTGAVSGGLTITYANRQIRLPITATGVMREALTVSTEEIDFGNVFAGTRSCRPLTLGNTSGDILRVEFEYREDRSFQFFKAYIKDARDHILAIQKASKDYNNQRGRDPSSYEELIQLGYLPRNEGIDRLWSFGLIGSPFTNIEAVSTSNIREAPGT